MSFPLAVALALALAFPRTGLAQDDPCLDSGCQSASPRFFYNSTRSRCERLVGGCGSNRNTFKTLESCQDLCHIKFVCYRPVQYGGYPPIRFSTGIRDTTVNFYFYNVSSGRCEGFHFRGWGSNGNIFRTVKECESLCGDVKDRCLDFMKYSSCQSESPRFFYNRTSSRCEQLFGDCRSNNKTFGTLESCEALCYGNDSAWWFLIRERLKSSVEEDAIAYVCF
ncbi:hypothetical protein EPR50_G00031820 [Perca flavescens]|uniref:BPTI/Kunitz inhibitor domain-containing protein n=1 Tax=Perca flavescens TaxID=8167 RepID=A0A484DJZ3_PERFV|nr:hypothetical protein EPR50_G00031820 [Perca flavescens]